MRRPGFFWIMFLVAICFLCPIISAEQSQAASPVSGDLNQLIGRTPRAREVVSQAYIELAGDRLYENGFYREAAAKYQEALDPRFISQPEDRNGPLLGISKSYEMLARYDEALAIMQDLIKSNPPPLQVDWWGLNVMEIYALKRFKQNGDKKSIYDYLEFRYQSVKELFMPKRVEDDFEYHLQKSLYLYEIIEDYDAALKLCDEYLAMKKVKKYKKFKAEVEDLRQTILEAQQTREKNKIFKKLNQYHFYNWL